MMEGGASEASAAAGRSFHVIGGLLLLSYGLFIAAVHSQEYQHMPTLSGEEAPAAPPTVLAAATTTEASTTAATPLQANCSCSDIKDKMALCQSSLATQTASFETAQERLTVCQTNVGALETQTATCVAQQQSLVTEKEQLQLVVAELQAKVEEKCAASAAAESSLSQAQVDEQVAQFKAEFAQEREVLQRQTQELRAQLEASQTKQRESDSQKHVLAQQVETFQAQLAAAHAESRELQAKLGEYETLQMDELPRQVEAFQNQLEASRVKENALQDQLGASQAKQQELAQKVETLSINLDESRTQQAQLSEQVASLQTAVSVEQERATALVAQHATDLEKARTRVLEESQRECKQKLVQRDAIQKTLLVENAQLRETAESEKSAAHKLQKNLLEVRRELFEANEQIRESRKLRDAVVKFYNTWSTWIVQQVVEHPQYPVVAAVVHNGYTTTNGHWQQAWREIKRLCQEFHHQATLLVPESIAKSDEWAAIQRQWCEAAGTFATLVELTAAPTVFVQGAAFVHTHCTLVLIYGVASLLLVIPLWLLMRRRRCPAEQVPMKKQKTL